jgi:glycosyltransferase involved in cell wall biosynthesis
MVAANTTGLVTAVMIFLNGEKYIAEAIESIIAQTYTNWELILVDDGSIDGATGIARDYATRYPGKIRYVEHEDHQNRGMSISRNVGVAAGSGEFISFLDADDIWLPNRLEYFLQVARDFPTAKLIYGPTLYWYSWAEARGEKPPVEGQEDFPGHNDLPARTLVSPPDVLRQFLVTHGGCLPGICSLLIDRSTFEQCGGFEPAFRGLYEDQVFLSKMAANFPIVVVDEVLDYYRQHSESCCWKSLESGEYDTLDHHPARAVYLRWLEQYIRQIGLKDRVIIASIRKQLLPYQLPLYIPLAKICRRSLRALKRFLRRYTPRSVRRVINYLLRMVASFRSPSNVNRLS